MNTFKPLPMQESPRTIGTSSFDNGLNGLNEAQRLNGLNGNIR